MTLTDEVRKRCAACGTEKLLSEMKTCMHAEMHHYVCDMKCMSDFYNPPKKAAAQPEPQGVELEVVGYTSEDAVSVLKELPLTAVVQLKAKASGSYRKPLCRLTDAQHLLSTERAEAERKMAEKDAEVEKWKARCQYNADTAHDVASERDQLRARLAERDREADRKRFDDPEFNKWLDEPITENGEYTVWDQIGDACAAWYGWENRPYYTKPTAIPYKDDPRSPSELSSAGCRCVRFGAGNPHWPCPIHITTPQPAGPAVEVAGEREAPEGCRQRLVAEGKPYPRSSCAVCGQFSPRWRECDAALAQTSGGETP